MYSGSNNYRRRCSNAYSNQEFTSTGHSRHPEFYDIQKCHSDNRYDRYKRSRRYYDDDNDEFSDYNRRSNRYSTRHRGGADFDDICETPRKRNYTRRNDCIDEEDENNLTDSCKPKNDCKRDRQVNPYRDFDADDEQYVNRRMNRGRCYDPCDEGRDHQRDQDRTRRHKKKKGHREKSRCRNDPCEAFNKQSVDPCSVNIHEVSHSCNEYSRRSLTSNTGCTPKSCLALKKKNQGCGDMANEFCTCKECPFCLLRLFCVEVLQELAEIKAKQIGGHLEGLVLADDVKDKHVRPSETGLSKKPRPSEDTLGRKRHDTSDDLRRIKSSNMGRSTDTLGRKRRRRSDEDFDEDYRGKRGRHSEDSFGRGRDRDGDRYDRDRDRDRYDRDRDRGRRGDDGRSDDFDGRGRGKDKKDKDKDKKDKKKEKAKKADEPAELPEDVKKELEKAKKKAEKEKQKKEKDRAKRALIEQRLLKSSQMANKGWVVKKYDGPGRFAEVNVCDFMRLRLESMLAREAALTRAACRPPPCMPPTCTINPKYCCSSFWCPPPSVPAICC